MSGLGDTIGEGGDPGFTGGRFDPGQGAGETGNAPVEPDPRHTPGRGYDPATGRAATAFGDPAAGLGYDPVTQTVAAAAEVLGETEKDAVPTNLPAGYYTGDHTRPADDNRPHVEEEAEEGKEKNK